MEFDNVVRGKIIYDQKTQGIQRHPTQRYHDPSSKMSKSLTHIRGHAVRLIDEPEEIRYVVRRAVTDSGRDIVFSNDPEKAGVTNLLKIYEVLTGKDRRENEAHFEAKGYAALKAEVAEVIVEALRPIRERYDELISKPEMLGCFASAISTSGRCCSGASRNWAQRPPTMLPVLYVSRDQRIHETPVWPTLFVQLGGICFCPLIPSPPDPLAPI